MKGEQKEEEMETRGPIKRVGHGLEEQYVDR